VPYLPATTALGSPSGIRPAESVWHARIKEMQDTIRAITQPTRRIRDFLGVLQSHLEKKK
jgi:hypothetical protein